VRIRRERRSHRSLRTRLFVAVLAIVVVSIGVTFAVGLVLTRRAVEHANLNDLGHQAQLIAGGEQEALLPLSKVRLRALEPFLAHQRERIDKFKLAAPPDYLPEHLRTQLRKGYPARGTVRISGTRYLYAARRVPKTSTGFVLLRPASLQAAGWSPFLRALLFAGLVGGALAAVGSLLMARAISRPLRQVADASRSLAEGVSPDPVPVGGSAELASLAVSFNEMAEQLQKAREAERNFLLSVSHELKTPLTAIRGYAEGLEEGAFDPEEAARTIREEARRLERLVHDLLDLARINRSEFTVHREAIDLGEVAREAVLRYEQDARACGVELEAIVDGPAPAMGDLDRALQVVSNLVENALRSTPGGGWVHVCAEPGLLTVEDTGRGLPPEQLTRAFDRFYLYDRTTEGRRIGTGLGLAIVRELTQKMGGSVSVRSTLGEGTAFFVRLPVPPPRLDVAGRAARPPAQRIVR
jgi:two-component system OmpR family sensor kinase